jgi:hypothetical protein
LGAAFRIGSRVAPTAPLPHMRRQHLGHDGRGLASGAGRVVSVWLDGRDGQWGATATGRCSMRSATSPTGWLVPRQLAAFVIGLRCVRAYGHHRGRLARRGSFLLLDPRRSGRAERCVGLPEASCRKAGLYAGAPPGVDAQFQPASHPLPAFLGPEPLRGRRSLMRPGSASLDRTADSDVLASVAGCFRTIVARAPTMLVAGPVRPFHSKSW